MVVGRDGGTHSGLRKKQQWEKPGDRNARDVTRKQGAVGLGWGVTFRAGREVGRGQTGKVFGEMGKRQAKESRPSDRQRDLGTVLNRALPSCFHHPVGSPPPGNTSKEHEQSQPRETVFHRG